MKLLLLIGLVFSMAANKKIVNSDFSSYYSISNFEEVNTYYDETSFSALAQNWVLSTSSGILNQNGVWSGNSKPELVLITNEKDFESRQVMSLNALYSGGGVTSSKEELLFTGKHKGSDKTESICISTLNQEEGYWESSIISEFQNSAYSFKHPSISKDGRFLYFSSDMPDGFGGFDLYMSYIEDGKWSTPINLGAGVNTEKDETSPFYHQNSGRVFFTSDGHDTFGGTDIFFCFNQGDTWSKAVNIGNSINSSSNETSIYFDVELKNGFMASDKKSGKGGFDIYKIERK